MARKYQILCDELRLMVSKLPENAGLPSVRNLMERYSVSQATVDRALRELRAERLVNTINGEGSYVARKGPASGSSSKLRATLLINDYPSSFYAAVEETLKSHFSKSGDELSIMRYPWSKRLSSVMRPGMTDALIILPSEYVDFQDISLLKGLGIPAVCLSTVYHGMALDAVGTDNELSGMMAADFLIKEGHRRLAMLLGEPRGPTTDPRLTGFCRQLQMASLPPPVLLDAKVRNGESSMLKTYACLSAELKLRRPDYTAVFSMSDATAIAACRAFHEAGLKVPDDISVLGYNDVPEAAMAVPSISSFRQDLDGWASCSMDIIRRRLSGEAEGPIHMTLPPKLIVRESTAKASGSLVASA